MATFQRVNDTGFQPKTALWQQGWLPAHLGFLQDQINNGFMGGRRHYKPTAPFGPPGSKANVSTVIL
jgi:hypothetical protein